MTTRQTNPVSAKGVTGFIIWTGENYIFRVYGEDGTFIDRNILHCDLEVTIASDDAYFYDTPYNKYSGCIDHAPETLGITE